MLVYGDSERIEETTDLAWEVADRLTSCQALRPGITRHQALVAAFIRAAELLQGVADADFSRTETDNDSPAQAAGAAVLMALAKALLASWDSGFKALPALSETWRIKLSRLAADHATIRTKTAEGYAFYALYPEAYAQAARRSGLGADTTVIGIRSIGTGLAAMVAAALDAPIIQTIRPIGHPFQRHLAIGPNLREKLLAGTGAFAVVDEGPGFSGSSFNSIADWLTDNGIAEERIHFFPSHAGLLGDVASRAHRQRWQTASRHVAEHELLPPNPAHRLDTWLAPLTGPLQTSLEDISGGAWRALLPGPPAPVDAALEQRKFFGKSSRQTFIAKFVGLGSAGERQLVLAQKLAEAGFTPPPIGFRHGFMVTPWVVPVAVVETAPPPSRLLDYLAFRATLPSTGAGASLSDLFAMAIHNIGERFGPAAAETLRTALGDPARFSPQSCCTDNRMHRWEWLHGAAGWLKLDATGHHAAHDLIGCQDIAWDLVGAVIELDLGDTETKALEAALATRLARSFEPGFMRAHALCYLGFGIGLWSMAHDRAAAGEREAILAHLQHYEQRLTRCGVPINIDLG